MPAETQATVFLLGCVKTKAPQRSQAKDLYLSPLWRGRPRYAERSGRPWFIVSALHGLVDPEELLDPYELALMNLPASARREWGQAVVEELESRLGSLSGETVEVHAGSAYSDSIEGSLQAAGAVLRTPLRGLRLGDQLAWYRSHGVSRVGDET